MVNQINTINYNLELLNKKSSQVTYGLSTGNALQNGSDDSIRYNTILTIQNSINSYNSISTNIENINSYNTLADSNIANIKTSMESINSEILKALNDTTSNEDRKIIATQIETLKETIYNLLNDSTVNENLFSGKETSQNAFSKDETTGKISYTGSYENKTVNVEQGKYVDTGVTGFELMYYTNQSATLGEDLTFSEDEIIIDKDGNQWEIIDSNNDGAYDGLYLNGDTSATSLSLINNGDNTYTISNTTTTTLSSKHSYFDDLDELIDTLKNSDNTDSSLSDSLEKFDLAYDNINTVHSLLGTRTSNIDNYSQMVQSKLTHFTLLEEEFASADLTALAVESQALENTYTALYSTINKINNLSLVNYLS